MPSINIELNLFDNRKVVRLERTLGPSAVLSLIRLWCHVGSQYPDSGGTADWLQEEVEAAASWNGTKGSFVDALMDLKLLHKWGDGFRVHDWDEHAGHLKKYRQKAVAMNEARWKKRSSGSARSTAVYPDPDFDPETPAENADSFLQDSCKDSCKDPARTPKAIQGNKRRGGGGNLPAAAPSGSSSGKAGKVKLAADGFQVPGELLASWGEAFPRLDVEGEIKKAYAHFLADGKRKKDFGRFLFNWLSRSEKWRLEKEAKAGREGGGDEGGGDQVDADGRYHRYASPEAVARQEARWGAGAEPLPPADDGAWMPEGSFGK